jgi:hypothetical protein
MAIKQFVCFSLLLCNLQVFASGTTNVPAQFITSVDRARSCSLVGPKIFATTPQTAEPKGPEKPWATSTMSWSGPCTNNKANGIGVARMLDRNSVRGIWYGKVKNGILHSGVIEDQSGMEAGGFLKGRWQASNDLEQEKAAIENARKAAQALILKFEKAGNLKSAAYYRGRLEFIDAMLLGE